MHFRSRPVISGIGRRAVYPGRLGGYVVAWRVLQGKPVKEGTESTLDQPPFAGKMDQSRLLEQAKEAPATRFRAPASGKGTLDILHTTFVLGVGCVGATVPSQIGWGCGRAREEHANPHHSDHPIIP